MKLFVSTVLVLTAAALTACASTGAPAGMDMVAATPTEQYPVRLAPAPDEVRLAAHSDGLSDAQMRALHQLALRWSDSGGGEVVIQSPRGGDEGAAFRTSSAARNFLMDLGVAPEQLRLVAYQGVSDAPDVVIVGYQRYAAVLPNCGQSWENLSRTGSNSTYGNFGCAVSANLAAQVANPTDLVSPRDAEPADAARRLTVIDKYRKGEVTSSARDEQAVGALSTAVQ